MESRHLRQLLAIICAHVLCAMCYVLCDMCYVHCVRLCACMCLCVHVCEIVCVYVCVHVCVCVCARTRERKCGKHISPAHIACSRHKFYAYVHMPVCACCVYALCVRVCTHITGSHLICNRRNEFIRQAHM